VAQIRVVDPTTGRVVAVSPPDTIARMREEVQSYQDTAQQLTRSRSTVDAALQNSGEDPLAGLLGDSQPDGVVEGAEAT
jgi:hypothetical protein